MKNISTHNLVFIAMAAAITCILAPFTIPIPVSPVPLSLTNFILLLSVYVLGRNYALISFLIYFILGFIGLPVFSGFAGGPGKIAGPTGGYLVGFLFMILISGQFIDRFHEKRILPFLGMVLGVLVANIFGTIWLALQMDISFLSALAIGVLPYLPGDILKMIIALIIGPVLRHRFSYATQAAR